MSSLDRSARLGLVPTAGATGAAALQGGRSRWPLLRLARARVLYLRRRELIANWLALLVLLSLGCMGPADDEPVAQAGAASLAAEQRSAAVRALAARTR